VVTFGPKETEMTLRAALSTGADRAFRVDAKDEDLDGDLWRARSRPSSKKRSRIWCLWANKRSTATRIKWRSSGRVSRLAAGHLRRQHQERRDKALSWAARSMAALESAGHPPAVVSVDLRIVAPKSVTSVHTPARTTTDGVRFAALMAIMAAKKSHWSS